MKTVVIDNGIATETNKCITWQFDNATHLVGFINTLKDFFEQSTKTHWDNWQGNVANIDTANDFGLAVWGKVLGCRRPILTVGGSGTDPNVFYLQLTGRLNKVNSSHSPSGSTVGFYYSNDDYVLVPFTPSGTNIFYLWKADETTFSAGTAVGRKTTSSINPEQIPFDKFKINGVEVQAEDIPGGGTMVHPQITSTVALSTELYRKILKARFQLLGKNASVEAYCDYLYSVFGSKMKVVDGLEMNLTFSVNEGQVLSEEESALVSQAQDVAFIYPAAVKNNTLRDKIAFGICDTRGSGWNGVFPEGTISKLDSQNATFIWR